MMKFRMEYLKIKNDTIIIFFHLQTKSLNLQCDKNQYWQNFTLKNTSLNEGAMKFSMKIT